MENKDKKAKTKHDLFLWFGVAVMVLSLILMTSYSVRVSSEDFVVFLGIILMPVSIGSVAAGILEGPRMRILAIFLVYIIFFGSVFMLPLFR